MLWSLDSRGRPARIRQTQATSLDTSTHYAGFSRERKETLKKIRMFGSLMIAVLAIIGCGADTPAPEPGEATATAAAVIDDDAEEALRAMSDWLAGQQSLRFTVQQQLPVQTGDEAAARVERTLDLAVEKPNKMRTHSSSEGFLRTTVFDGERLVVIFPEEKA